MSASESKVIMDDEGDLSPSQKPVLSGCFVLLEADLLSELGILDDLIQSWGNLRVQHLKIWKIFSFTDREHFSSSKESTIFHFFDP